MPYLIDGNNLAGKLGILDEAGWDKKLIKMIQEYCQENNKKAILVFDSNDTLGDRYTESQVTVIYAPKDAVYNNADDKIIELMPARHAPHSEAGGKNKKRPEDWVVISDDIRILDEADKLNIKTILAKDFAKKLKQLEDMEISEDELNDEEKKEINKELLKKWG